MVENRCDRRVSHSSFNSDPDESLKSVIERLSSPTPSLNWDDTPPQKAYFIDGILSVLRFCSWLLLFPHSIVYHKKQRKYLFKSGHIVRLALGVMMHLVLIDYVLWAVIQVPFDGVYPVHQVILNVGTMVFWIFYIFIAHLWWCKGGEMVFLLNEGNRILKKIKAKSPSKLVKYTIWPIIILTVTSTTLYSLSVFQATVVSTTSDDLDESKSVQVSALVQKTVHSFCAFHHFIFCNSGIDGKNESKFTDLEPTTGESLRQSESTKSYLIFTFITAVGLDLELLGVLSHLAVTFWALFFRHILQSFLEKVERGGLMNLQEVIGIFNEITILLEEWNKTFQFPLLFMVVSSLLYKIITFSTALSNNGTVTGVLGILSLLYFVPFMILMLSCAEVRRLVASFPSVIKKMFIIPGDRQLHQITNLQGMQLIYHEILLKSVGMKGMEFFTISYAFIAQMVGIIFTLSIVTLQLNSFTKVNRI